MKILFLHGFESKLSSEKRIILEKYGHVISSDLDYKSNPNIIEHLYNTYFNQKIEIIIGSSMGGFVGYHLANLFGVPSMLYNPAFPYRNGTKQNYSITFSNQSSRFYANCVRLSRFYNQNNR